MQHYISDVMESDIVAFRIIKDADLTQSFTNVLSGSFHPAVIKLGYPSLCKYMYTLDVKSWANKDALL